MNDTDDIDNISYNPHTRELIKQNKSMPLRRKVAAVLEILLKNRHRIVEREELLSTIWRQGTMRENSLLQCIRELRQTLGDNAQQPEYIKTYHTKGYQWINSHTKIIDTTHKQVDKTRTLGSDTEKCHQHRNYLTKITPLQLFTLAIIVLVCVTSFLYWPKPNTKEQATSKHITLALLPFANKTGDSSLQWVQMGLSDMVMSVLAQSSRITVIPMHDVQQALLEQSQSSSENQLRTTLKADYLIKSHITQTKLSDYQFSYQIFNQQGILKSQTLTISDLIAAIPTIVQQFSNQLMPNNNDLLTFLSLSTNYQANRDYANGIQALKTKGAPLAKHHFEAALINDPNFMWAHAQLALVLGQLGHWIKAKTQFQNLLKQQEINNDLALKSFVLLGLAHILLEQSLFNQAEAYLQTTIELSEITNDHYTKASALWGLSNIAEYRSQWDEQHRYAKQAMTLTNNITDLRIKADNLYYLGSPSNSRLEFDNKIDMQKNSLRLQRALNYYQKLNDLSSQARTLLSMGENYTFNFAQRIDFLKQAEKLYQHLNNKIQLANTLSYTGFLYIQYHQGANALFPLQTSYQITKSIGAIQAELLNRFLLAFSALDQGINNKNTNEKIQYLNIAAQQFISLRNDPRLHKDTQLFADASLLVGWTLSEQGKHTTAIRYIKQALNIYLELKLTTSTAYSIMSLVKEYTAMKNWRQALQYINSPNQTKRTRQYFARSYYELKYYDKALEIAELNKSLNISKWTKQDEKQLQRYQLVRTSKHYLNLPPEPSAHSNYCETLPENI